MATTQVENEVQFEFDTVFYNDQITKVIDHFLPQFDRIPKSFFLFNMVYLVTGCVELFLLIFFFTFLVQSSLLAFSFALIFLTVFSFFILRLYLTTKKPEQFQALTKRFLKSCRNLLNYNEDIPEHHLVLANACARFATTLEGREYKYHRLHRWLDPINPSLERLSCWMHWGDVLSMRELLLNRAIAEHIKLVRFEPTSLEVHAGLANAYVMLSSLYLDPRKVDGYDSDQWLPPEKYSQEMEKRYRTTAERAIEEFKIVSDYAPDDPWVHAQLAYSYHDLGLPHEEIREYEAILSLCPDDKDSLYKLGILYFQQGFNAKGLEVYEELKKSSYRKAEKLIRFYGKYKTYEIADFD